MRVREMKRVAGNGDGVILLLGEAAKPLLKLIPRKRGW